MADYKHPEMLVSTAWVAEHLNDPKVRLVEVDVDTSQYEQGHIAGAVGWNWQSQLCDNVRRDICTKQEIEHLLSSSGIGNSTTVVLYGDNNNWFAAYALWQLVYWGHQDVKLMNGGRKKWLEERRPLTTDAPKITPVSYKAKEPDKSIRAFRDDVFKHLETHKPLVDVRSVKEYTGELLHMPNYPQEGAQRGGHIPGAASIPWSQAVNESNSTFKTADELAELYQSKGITKEKEIIAYCRIGERSSHTWFALKYLLGYQNVRNYDGSWTEWGNLVNAPIEK